MAHTLELAILVMDICRLNTADFLKFSKKRSDQLQDGFDELIWKNGVKIVSPLSRHIPLFFYT